MMTSDVLFTVAAKGAVVLSVALGAGVALRARSSAARHFMYGLALLAAIALVPLSELLPAWGVPLLSAVAPSSPQAVPGAVGNEAAGIPVSDGLVSIPSAPQVDRQLPAAVQRVDSGVDWKAIFVDKLPMIWLVGALLVAAYHVAGVLFVARMRRRSRLITDAALGALRDDIARSLGITRRVALYSSDDASMPVTWGTQSPGVLLPASWQEWSDDRTRAVLQHELAHVARRDCAWQLVASLACALHWFDPAVWLAARRLRAERERACDDLVLQAGIDAYDYADHLLDVARSYRAPRLTAMAAIAMARPTQLEGRLLAILDTRIARSAPSRARQVAAALVVGVLLLPTAAMRPWVETPGGVRVATLTPGEVTPGEVRAGTLTPYSDPTPLPARTDTLAWTRHMNRGQWLKVYTMKSDVVVEASRDDDVHVITIFGADDGRGPRQHEFDEDEKQIEVCPALPLGVKRIPKTGCWPVDWKAEVAADNAVRTVVQVPEGINVDVKTSSGDIMATRAMVPITAGSVDGSIRISTSAYATANTVNGDVDVTLERTAWRGSISMKTVSGRISLLLPADANTDVEVMNSTGDSRTSFALDRAWRGDRWRMHGSATLGNGGRKVTAESWTGAIVVRRVGEQDLLPLHITYGATDDEDPNPNPNPDGPGGSPSYSPSPSPSPSPRARTRVLPALNAEYAGALGAYPYDALPRQHDQMIDKPYRATLGGVTGERMSLELPAGFLRKYSRPALRGAPDSAAIARLAQLATAQWLAYHMGDTDPGVELAGERALWALSRSNGRTLLREVMHEMANGDWRARAYAAWTLGELRASSANEYLIDALGDPMARVRAAAASALSRTHPGVARAPLEKLLRDDDYRVRAAALSALGAIGDARSLPALQPLLRDPHAMVRAEAEAALPLLVRR